MIPIAPRYDSRILELAAALDDRDEPMAEICRRVAFTAEALGLFRPSYPHIRRFLVAKRDEDDAVDARRRRLRTIAADAYFNLARGRLVDPWELERRVQEAGR